MSPISIGHTSIRSAVLAVALVGVAALSGCIGSADETLDLNLAPEAVLEVDRSERWTGETFTFNASASSDPDGNITHYRFDFGDGTVVESEDGANATAVEHVYQAGGIYAVTLTVTDDGGDKEGKRTATSSVLVTVNERQQVPAQIQYASPTGDQNMSKSTHGFTAGDDATAYEADLQVRGMIPAGGSDVTLRVVDANGTVLEEQNVSVEATGNETVRLKGHIATPGDHTIEILVTSGGAAVEGVLRIYYDAEPVEA